MTRVIALALITVFATHMTAHAFGQTSYYSYSDHRTACYISSSSDKPAE